MNNKVFGTVVHVKGDCIISFVFSNKNAASFWVQEVFPRMKKETPNLSYTLKTIDRLRVGDKCYVRGDGSEVYTIDGLVRYSDNRYGFLLNSGWTEEVHKCYSVGGGEV